jgi:transposase
MNEANKDDLIKIIAKQKAEIEALKEQVKLLTDKLFGKKSEKNRPSHNGPTLFDEAEVEAAKTEAEETVEETKTEAEGSTEVKTHSRVRGKRKPLPESLPRVDVVIEIPEDQRRSLSDNSVLEEIREEVSEFLDIIPAKVQVIRVRRKVYASKTSKDGEVKIAPQMAMPIPKSNASPGLLAWIATAKFCDHLPLYRQETIFERGGVEMSRTTMARWMIELGDIFDPLVALIKERVHSSGVCHVDETTVQVLKEKGRKPENLSYMWVISSGKYDTPAVLFEYHARRSAKTAAKFLDGFKGKMITDGYKAYASVAEQSELIHFGCWAHARRKFDEAMRVGAKSGGSLAKTAIEKIALLYKVEKEAAEMSTSERAAYRGIHSTPLVKDFFEWVHENRKTVPPKCKLGVALSYAANHEHLLKLYVEHGDVAIDNNHIESLIRQFVMGRGNWMFCDTTDGAHASATIYSLIITAKKNGLDPFAYLRDILTRIPRGEALEPLLPWNWKSAEN